MEQPVKYTLGKNERLKSRKLIEELFKHGSAISLFPIKVIYQRKEYIGSKTQLQAGFTVGTKNFKKATDRNRIRRLMRETYRLQKHSLNEVIIDQQKCLVLFFIYIGKEIPDYVLMEQKMKAALNKMQSIIST